MPSLKELKKARSRVKTKTVRARFKVKPKKKPVKKRLVKKRPVKKKTAKGGSTKKKSSVKKKAAKKKSVKKKKVKRKTQVAKKASSKGYKIQVVDHTEETEEEKPMYKTAMDDKKQIKLDSLPKKKTKKSKERPEEESEVQISEESGEEPEESGEEPEESGEEPEEESGEEPEEESAEEKEKNTEEDTWDDSWDEEKPHKSSDEEDSDDEEMEDQEPEDDDKETEKETSVSKTSKKRGTSKKKIKPLREEGPHEEKQATLSGIKMVSMKHQAIAGKHHHNCLFVIFGATGDLARKKIIPALYKLIKNEELKDFAVVGVARQATTAIDILESAKQYVPGLKKDIWQKLKERFVYQRANFYHEAELDLVKDVILETEKEHGLSGNRLFYLAIMPKHFEIIIDHLEKHRLAHGVENWNRVVFEKPFGEDLKTAQQINRHIRRVFKEEQIYRVDHYLDKELVQNLITSRFTNEVLEPIWNKKHIDHVQLIMSEDFGIEGRGSFYDKYGALKDVVQNHMLQLLCLTAMEAPKTLKADDIRDRKVKLMKRIKPLCKSEVVLGQFEGYRKEQGVAENSETETFAAIKLRIRNRRWRKVPFYLLAGKNLPFKAALIYIQFKNKACKFYKNVCKYEPNHLVIQIQPKEGMYLQLNAKVPGKNDVQPIDLEFCYKCTFGPKTPEAYENLLLQVVHGDQSVFVRSDEIECEWKVIEKLLKNRPALESYEPGKVPEKADKLIKKDGRAWHFILK